MKKLSAAFPLMFLALAYGSMAGSGLPCPGACQGFQQAQAAPRPRRHRRRLRRLRRCVASERNEEGPGSPGLFFFYILLIVLNLGLDSSSID